MKYFKNENYFKKIDTEAKAYFLGLLYADGSNIIPKQKNKISSGRTIKLALQSIDKEILEIFSNEIEGNIPIKFEEKSLKNSNHKNIAYINICSNNISKDLIKLGCVPNKHKKLQFPPFKIVPQELMPHFIRGYFDGDGCIWDGKRKEMRVKDSTRKEGGRVRIVHNVKFQFTGYKDFILGLKFYLVNNFNFNDNKLNYSKNKDHPTLEYSGRQQAKKIYDVMYKNASIFLKRKEIKFKNIINCANIQ